MRTWYSVAYISSVVFFFFVVVVLQSSSGRSVARRRRHATHLFLELLARDGHYDVLGLVVRAERRAGGLSGLSLACTGVGNSFPSLGPLAHTGRSLEVVRRGGALARRPRADLREPDLELKLLAHEHASPAAPAPAAYEAPAPRHFWKDGVLDVGAAAADETSSESSWLDVGGLETGGVTFKC